MPSNTPLYKYISSVDAALSVLGGNIKFAEPAKLNDPSELVGAINRDKVQASLEQIRQSGFNTDMLRCFDGQVALFQRFCPHLQAIPMPRSIEEADQIAQLAFYDNLDVLEAVYQEFVQAIRDSVGVASLTKNPKKLPMWAHYANNAKGFVLEFADLEDAFTGDETQLLNEPKDLRYSQAFEGVTFDPHSTPNLFFWKFSDWAYEEEVRVVRALEDCENVGKDMDDLWIARIDPRHVTGVIVGWNADAGDTNALIDFCKDAKRPIKLSQASFKGVNIQFDDISY